MGRQNVTHRDVQESTKWNLRVFLRELNVRLRDLAQAVNFNNQLMWTDMRFPAAGLNPPGPTGAPGTNTTYGFPVFDSNNTELVAAFVQFPHEWAEGTTIVPHVHWCKTTNAGGTVQWELEWWHVPIGGVITSLTTLQTDGSTVPGTPDNNTQWEHLISSFGDVDTTGWEISDMLICHVKRIGGDATYDTYGADAALLEFDIHYQKDARGSVNPFNKDAN